MNLDFKDLVEFYRKAKETKEPDQFTYFIGTYAELNLLKKLMSDDNVSFSKLSLANGILAVGNEVKIVVGQPDFKLGGLYFTIESFLKADMTFITNGSSSNKQYYIFSEKVASFDEKKPEMLLSYEIVKEFILQLISVDAYTDKTRKNLIFFSKKTLELSIDVRDKIIDFMDELKKINNQSLDGIRQFSQWLSNKETSSHYDEKKSILAFVLADTLPETPNIIDVLRRIKKISEAVQAQYGLYLENFSYARFVKKLEENSENFVKRINDTISKILPQLLGLPFLAAIVTALNAGDNLLVYMALFTYSLISILALSYQNAVLNDIRDEIKNYVKNGNIPEALTPQWTGYRNKFYKLIKKQKSLYRVLLASAGFCLLYCLYKLFYCEPIHSSVSTLQEWIITYINSVRR